jgi:SepF-like predicted cell division protein (DUF552 family)
MRGKMYFKKGVLYFAAVASALTLTAGSFGGYSLIAFAEGETTTTPAADTTGTSTTNSSTGTDEEEPVVTPPETPKEEEGGEEETPKSEEGENPTPAQPATTAAATKVTNASIVAKTTAADTSDDNDTYYYDDTDDTDTETTAAAEPVSVKVSGTNSTRLANTVKEVAEGSTVTVDMSSTKTISKDVLEAAKSENVELVLDMGGYTWTIDAANISSELHDVNLGVEFGTNDIPQDEIASLAGDDSYQTISLDYDGPFGFTASLGFNVGSGNVGKFVNLYYYNQNNELEYQNSGIVDAKGNTTVTFSHASEYLAIISDTMPDTTVTDKSPVTADTTNTIPFLAVMCAAAAVLLGLAGYRKNND